MLAVKTTSPLRDPDHSARSGAACCRRQRRQWQTIGTLGSVCCKEFADASYTIVQGVSQSRGLPQAAVEAAIDEAPLTAQRAVALKLLDAAKYR